MCAATAADPVPLPGLIHPLFLPLPHLPTFCPIQPPSFLPPILLWAYLLQWIYIPLLLDDLGYNWRLWNQEGDQSGGMLILHSPLESHLQDWQIRLAGADSPWSQSVLGWAMEPSSSSEISCAGQILKLFSPLEMAGDILKVTELGIYLHARKV